ASFGWSLPFVTKRHSGPLLPAVYPGAVAEYEEAAASIQEPKRSQERNGPIAKRSTDEVMLKSNKQHGVTKAVEPVRKTNCVSVRDQHAFTSGESADQHKQ